MTLDYVLKAIAILVIVWGVLNLVFPSKVTPFNILVLFSVFFGMVIAVLAGATLLAVHLLHPGALTSGGFADLVLALAPAAGLSALFMLLGEEPAIKFLGLLGMDRVWAETGFAFVHGLATAVLLMMFASYVPGVEIAPVAALAAGLIAAFAFYFGELVFVHSGSADTEEMALMESSLEDEED
ncbi:MAG: hypothetical protein ACFB50_02460 [Rubrobacteraceae bacterium]